MKKKSAFISKQPHYRVSIVVISALFFGPYLQTQNRELTHIEKNDNQNPEITLLNNELFNTYKELIALYPLISRGDIALSAAGNIGIGQTPGSSKMGITGTALGTVLTLTAGAGQTALNLIGNTATTLTITPGANTSGVSIATSGTAPALTLSGGTPALSITAGGQTITAGDLTMSNGNIALTNSTSATTGNITKGGARFLHNFGSSNTFLGINSGNFAGTLTGISNTGLGYQTLTALTTGSNNIAVGNNALFNNTTGVGNIGVGVQTLQASTGDYNIAMGFQTLINATTGNYNLAFGQNCMGVGVVTGSENVALGASAFKDCTSGARNMCIGNGSLFMATTASRNVAIGYLTGSNGTFGLVSGNDNVLLGYQAGASLTGAESGNIYIGSGQSGIAGENNTTRIGFGNATTRVFMPGIDSVNVGATADIVAINSSNQLGTSATLFMLTGNESVTGSVIAGTTITAGTGVIVTTGGLTATAGGLTVTAGGATITGTTSINTTGAATTSIATGGTGILNLGNTTGNTFFTGNVTLQNQGQLRLQNLAGTFTAALQAPALLANYTLTLPLNTGTSTQVLTTDGAGVLSWTSVASAATAFVQNGNSFSAAAVLGTLDNNSLTFITNGAINPRLSISNTGAVTINAPTTGVALAVTGNSASTAQTINAGVGRVALDITNGNINLTNSTSATTGNITKFGTPFIHTFGSINTFVGINAGNFTLTAGGNNTGFGYQALTSLTTGVSNTAVGVSSLVFNSSGTDNTGLGVSTLYSNTTGSDNIAIGVNAGSAQTTGSGNIYVGSGQTGAAGESLVIRIGNVTGGITQSVFITGIDSKILGSTADIVAINGGNQLGTSATTLKLTGNESVTGSVIAGTTITAGTGVIATTGGLTATAGGLTVTAGGANITGTTTINTTGAATTSIATGGTGVLNLGNITGNTFFTGNVTLQNQGQLRLQNPAGTFTAALQAPALLANYTLTLPLNTGTSTQVLTTDGAGVLSWTSVASAAAAFVQGGNNFGAAAVLGTLDNNSLTFITNGVINPRLSISNAGEVTINPPTTGIALAVTGNGSSTAQTITAGAGQVALDITNGNINLTNSTPSTTTGNITKNGALFIHNFGSNNTFTGVNAGNLTLTGIYNAGFGYQALTSLTTGSLNTAIGGVALSVNTTGFNNTAIGAGALGGNTTGSYNVGVGRSAGSAQTIGSGNIYIGTQAGIAGESGVTRIGNVIGSPTTPTTACYIAGIDSTILGATADIVAITSGNLLGTSATLFMLTGNESVTGSVTAGTGVIATTGGLTATAGGLTVTAGGANITAGNVTLSNGNINLTNSTSATTGNITKNSAPFIHNFGTDIINAGNNTFTGVNAGNFTLTSADYNSGFGYQTLINLTTGANNTALGAFALTANQTGPRNTAVGAQALLNTTGTDNTAIGVSAGSAQTTGSGNITIGSGQLGVAGDFFVTRIGNVNGGPTQSVFITGIDGVTLGATADIVGTLGSNQLGTTATTFTLGGSLNLANSTTTNGNILKANALFIHNFGSNNTFTGVTAGNLTLTGDSNAGFGFQSLIALTTGRANTAVGQGSLQTNSTGIENVAVGASALFNNTTGNNNVALGTIAGSAQTTGSGNIYIGSGQSGLAAESFVTRIGNTTGGATTSCFIGGIRGVTTSVNNAIAVLIDGNGQLGTISSSRRYKKDIVPVNNIHDNFMALNPVAFSYKSDDSQTPQYGLIAEEVEQLFPELVVYKDGEVETIKYHLLYALLIKMIQENTKLSQENRTLIEELQQAFALMKIKNLQ